MQTVPFGYRSRSECHHAIHGQRVGHLPDGTTETINTVVTVVDKPKQNTEHDPSYEPGKGKPGETVKVSQTGDKNLPEGTKFSVPSDSPVTVDPKAGVVTVQIDDKATPGTVIEETVTVTHPDGSKDEVPVKVTVQSPDKVLDPEPSYADTIVKAGATTSVKPTNTGDAYPSNTKFAIDKDFTAPKGYTVTIDQNTGEISVTVALLVRWDGRRRTDYCSGCRNLSC